MEGNQLQSANGAPESDKTKRSVVGAIDTSMIALIDHVLDVESAVRENTGQLKMMESQVALVREIPRKMAAAEQQMTAVTEQVDECAAAFNRLWERVDEFEKSTVRKFTERIDGLELAMRQVAQKPAVWGAEMSDLRIELQRHAELFEKPQVKTVHHRHYLNWYIWIVIGLTFWGVGLSWFWLNAQENANLKASHDVLWRGARQFLDTTLQQQLDSVESHYDANPVQFQQDLKAQEAHSAELTQRLQEANQRQQEADQKRREADQAQWDANRARGDADSLKKQKKKR